MVSKPNCLTLILLDTEHWQSFSLVMTYNENMKSFKVISKYLEMKDERQKCLPSSSVAFVPKERELKGKRPFRSGKHAKNDFRVLQNSQPKNGIAKKQETSKGNEKKNTVRVKFYNCGRKGDLARDCPELAKVPSPTKTSKNMCVFMHWLLTFFLNGL